MYFPTTIDDLQSVVETEREALIAAAILPQLPDDNLLLRVRDTTAPASVRNPDELERFEDRVPTIGASKNLRRVTPSVLDVDAIDEDTYEVGFDPVPHGIRSYNLSLYDVDLIHPVQKPGEYDFDDTDQAFLSDFGVTPSPVDAVHLGVDRTDDAFARKPRFPV